MILKIKLEVCSSKVNMKFVILPLKLFFTITYTPKNFLFILSTRIIII